MTRLVLQLLTLHLFVSVCAASELFPYGLANNDTAMSNSGATVFDLTTPLYISDGITLDNLVVRNVFID